MLMHAGPLLFLLLLPCPELALSESVPGGRIEGEQAKEIQVSGHVGWGSLSARGDWAPVLVDVDNRGDKDRDLVLVLTWAFPGSSQQSASPGLGNLDGRSGPSHHVPVTVAARSRRRVSVTMLAPDQDRMSVWAFALSAPGGRGVASAELQTRPVEPGHRLIAVVGTDLPDGFPSAANAVGRILPEALPEDWRGYAGLDALLWLDGRPAEIRSQAQVDALRAWISSGGRLVVARANDAGIPGSALADLLPVTPRSAVTLDGLELQGKRLAGRVAVLDSAVRAGTVTVRQGAVPLVVDAPFDAGRVIFVAFDPSARPFAGSDAAAGFWTSLLGKPSPVRSDSPGEMRAPRILGSTGLAQVAGRFPDVEPPAIGWLFVLIIAYLVVVGPLDYFVLRAFRRLELTWITFPAYVVGFTLFILVAGGAFMGRAAYQREIAVIDHHVETGFARHRALSAVLAPTDLVYSIRDAEPVSSNFTARSLLQDFSDKLSETRILHEKEPVAEGWILNRSYTGLAHADRCSRAPSPVTWKLEGPPQARVRVTVTNSGSTPYTLARLVTPSGVFDLGEIPPGRKTFDAGRIFERASQYVQAEGTAPQPANYGYYRGREGQISEAELNGQVRGHLLHLTFGSEEGTTGFARTLEARRWVESGGSILVGWSQSADPQVVYDPFPSRRSGIQMTRFYRGPEQP